MVASESSKEERGGGKGEKKEKGEKGEKGEKAEKRERKQRRGSSIRTQEAKGCPSLETKEKLEWKSRLLLSSRCENTKSTKM